jgi:hypothetical protein
MSAVSYNKEGTYLAAINRRNAVVLDPAGRVHAAFQPNASWAVTELAWLGNSTLLYSNLESELYLVHVPQERSTKALKQERLLLGVEGADLLFSASAAEAPRAGLHGGLAALVQWASCGDCWAAARGGSHAALPPVLTLLTAAHHGACRASGHTRAWPWRCSGSPLASNGTRAGSSTGAPMLTVTRPQVQLPTRQFAHG